MKNRILFAFVCTLGLLMSACNNEVPSDNNGNENSQTIKLNAQLPSDDDIETRTTPVQPEGSKYIDLLWKNGDKMQITIAQHLTGMPSILAMGDNLEVQSISGDGKTGSFNVTIADGLFEDYILGISLTGVHGAAVMRNNQTGRNYIYVNATPAEYFTELSKTRVPIFFREFISNPGGEELKEVNVNFQHYGLLQVVTLKNTSNQPITIENAKLAFSGEKWYYDADAGKEAVLISTEDYDNKPANYDESIEISSNNDTYPPIVVGAGKVVKLAHWVMSNGKTPPALKMTMNVNGAGKTTTTEKPARSQALENGKAYHLYVKWDGTNLNFTSEADVQPEPIAYSVGDYYPDPKAVYNENKDLISGIAAIGIVYWLDNPENNKSKHGKIVSLDEGDGIWGNYGINESAWVTGIRDLNDGKTATENLIAKRKDESGFATIYYAFNWIYQTKNNGDGKGIWYLPAKDELKALSDAYSTYGKSDFNGKLTAASGGIGLSDNWYWSSSESGGYGAWIVYLGGDSTHDDIKSYLNRVRAVSAF